MTKEIAMPQPNVDPAPVAELEDLHEWVHARMVEAQHGQNIEDAGRVSAYSRVMVEIRERQRRAR